jgi:hypothetical protein
MKSLADIIKLLQKQKEDLASRYPIASLAVFGSFARNENVEGSDVDILVEFSDSVGIKFIDLADELEDILKLKVDLVSRKGIKQKYFEHLQSEMISVY